MEFKIYSKRENEGCGKESQRGPSNERNLEFILDNFYCWAEDISVVSVSTVLALYYTVFLYFHPDSNVIRL